MMSTCQNPFKHQCLRYFNVHEHWHMLYNKGVIYLPTIDVVIVNESCRKPLNRVLVQLSQLLAEQEGGL